MAGLAVAAVKDWSGPQQASGTAGGSLFPIQFEEALKTGYIKDKVVQRIRDIKIHPATTYFENSNQETKEEFITFVADVQHKQKDKVLYPADFTVTLRDEKGVRQSAVGSVKGMSAGDYLTKLKTHLEGLDKTRYKNLTVPQFSVAWSEDPKKSYLTMGLVGFVVVGLVWPTILNFLIGAGLGRASKEELVDLSKYKSKPEPAKAAKPTVTQEDMDKLQELEAELEASLRAGAMDSAPAQTRGGVKAPAPVRVLTGKALEPPKEPEKKDADKPKAFGADNEDFYPTEVHGKKKD